MEPIILITKDELTETIKKVIMEADLERQAKENEKSFSLSQTAKRLNRSHTTIRRYLERGLLKATPDNRILESEIQNLLTSKHNT
jgi:response regulator of citrate/malate metabolism